MDISTGWLKSDIHKYPYPRQAWFFHWHTFWTICNKVLIEYPTTP